MSVSQIYRSAEAVRGMLNSVDGELDDETVMDTVYRHILSDSETRGLSLEEKRELANGIFSALRKELDFLEKYLNEPDISEIMVNGPEDIFVEEKGKIRRIPETFPSAKELEEVIMRIGARIHREINELNPILDARLSDGSRVNAVYRNVAVNGPTLNIRKFPDKRITMEELIAWNSITAEAAGFLKVLVESGYNIFVSGGTSSGKTTFLNALSDYIPSDERVIVIEDAAELQLDGIENIVRLETRKANVQGKGEVTMSDLIKSSLRMRPDRILVGEVRGAEVVDMLNSMNTGHDGSLSTGHANSARGMMSRLETMFLSAADFPIEAVRGQITTAIDVVVHLGRLKDRTRRVLEISELVGVKDGEYIMNPLYVYRVERKDGLSSGALVPTGNRLKSTVKLDMKGVDIYGS